VGAPLGGSGSDEMVSGINMTPLVDITLVLLVVFLVTAKVMVAQALPMDLPKAGSGGEVQTVLAVGLDEKGAISLEKRPVATDDELLAAVRRTVAEHPDARAVLHADGRTSHANVVHAMDVLRRGGLSRIAFAVLPTTPASLEER
jgi:biopolymer transport protein ExbD